MAGAPPATVSSRSRFWSGPSFLAGLVLCLGLFAYAKDRFSQWIDATTLPALILPMSAEVLDRHGQLLRAYTVGEGRWRMATDLGDVDPALIKALITFEDKRFYSHGGVDPRAIARAVAQAAWNGRVISGGSTLTMQVARLLEETGTGRMAGKLRQMRVAWALERRLTKEQILGLYLRLAPYGGNIEGLRAASFAYLGKEPGRLTPAEIALFIALPQSPESRRPDRHPQAANRARDRVLDRLASAGLISGDQANAAKTEQIPTVRGSFPQLAAHLADRARRAFPQQNVQRLTIDATLQRSLESLAQETVQTKGDRVQIALVVVDHRSAEVLASIGSARFTEDLRAGFVDMTQAIRSPGSVLKPLVYGLAFDQGLAHPETLVEDRPSSFQGYRPTNFDRQYRGTIRTRESLQLSLNIPVVALTQALGPARLTASLTTAQVPYRLPAGEPGLAIALGGIGVTLEGMTSLYATIARGGVARPLSWHMDAVATDGQRLLSERSAWYLSDILSGMPPPPGAPENRLAYKTGTSYGHRDAWAIGFDGQHVIGVWMGRPDGTPVPGAFGADQAAPILFQAFGRLKHDLHPLPLPPASALLVANKELPLPLQRFRARGAVFGPDAASPVITFPPEGATVERLADGFLARVEGGSPPFLWMINETPILTGQNGRSAILGRATDQDEGGGAMTGFITLSVIDSTGRSSRIRFRLQ